MYSTDDPACVQCALSNAETRAPFVWLIGHQRPVVFFSRNKSATSDKSAVLFSQSKPAPAMSHQPNEQAVRSTANQTGAQHASSEIKNLTVIKKNKLQ
jgi:hypothetical protein